MSWFILANEFFARFTETLRSINDRNLPAIKTQHVV
jgi:hypothetical protein